MNDVFEDRAMGEAIQEGLKTKVVSRAEVFRVLDEIS
jgi:hypothetical protein